MKRPLVLVGFSYLLTLAAAVFIGAEASCICFGFCLGGFAVTFFCGRTRKVVVFPLAFLTAAAALGSFCLNCRFTVAPVQALDGRDLMVSGTVCGLPYRQYGRWYYVIRTDSVSDPETEECLPQCFKLRISCRDGLDAEPYSRVEGKIHVFLPSGSDGYSSRSYFLSRGITLFGYLYEYQGVSVTEPKSLPPYGYILKLREAMQDSIDAMLPSREASMVRGVFLGDKASLPEDVVSDFRVDGISHLLAVSGLHMATIAELLLLFLAFLHVPKRLSALLTGAGIFCFMAVTGFVPSVTRSGIMFLLCLGAPLISRRADSLNSLSAAVLILCAANPWAAADVGLLLSFSATLGLILLSGRISGYLNGKWDKIKALQPLVRGVNGILATSFAAILFTLPILILNFGAVSVIAPLSNLLALVPSSLMVGCSAVASVLGVIAPQSYLSLPFALIAGLLAKYLQAVAHWLSQIPFASISASYGFVRLWLAGTILLFAAAAALSRRKNRNLLRASSCLSVIVLLTGILSYQVVNREATRVAVLDVGTGLSVAVTRGGHAAVIGCGGYDSSAVEDYLNAWGVSCLDYLQPLTRDGEEAVNLSSVACRLNPGQLVSQEENRVDGFHGKAAAHSRHCCWYQREADGKLWGDVEIRTVSCSGTEAVFLEADGVSVLIFPGRADTALLPQLWSRPDFLVTDAAIKNPQITPFCTVYSMDGQDLAARGKSVFRTNSVWTGSAGNIILQIGENRKLTVRREN